MTTYEARVVGIGETAVGKLPGRGAIELQAEAVNLALADAGIAASAVDGLFAISPYVQPVRMHSTLLAEYLAIHPAVSAAIDVGGTVSTMVMLLNAIDAIERGRADVVVCVYGDNAATGRHAGVKGIPLQASITGTEEFEEPFGAFGMVIAYALLAQRYLDTYGLDGDVFAPVAIAARAHAARNENAQFRTPLTLEDYLASPMMASPLRKLDCCPISDGAGAVVLASSRAKARADVVPVSVLGFGSLVTHNVVSQMPDLDGLGMAPAASRAFAEAGLGPGDIDVLMVHDAFTVSVPLSLEGMGFCAPGEGTAFAASGAIGPGGALPTNTHGGLLAQAHIGGMLHIVEAVRQLRGQGGARQVPGAEVAAIAGNGGVFSTCGVMLLGAEGGR